MSYRTPRDEFEPLVAKIIRLKSALANDPELTPVERQNLEQQLAACVDAQIGQDIADYLAGIDTRRPVALPEGPLTSAHAVAGLLATHTTLGLLTLGLRPATPTSTPEETAVV